MKLIIDTEIIKDLIENEWGYEGIRDDLDEIFEKHGIPLDKIKKEIDEQSVMHMDGEFYIRNFDVKWILEGNEVNK